MNDYRELRVEVASCCEEVTDVLAALLADCGFESFVPDETGLTAYCKAEDYNPDAVKELIDTFPLEGITLTIADDSIVEGRDWNSEWEKNYFKPIVIGGQCVIHSTFHTDFPQCEHEIIIDPKMAFGTGHHSTTELMATRILELDLDGMSLIDMGTGTGILAILARQCGAETVTGIEIDPAAHINAVENVALNGVPAINIILGDASALAEVAPADYFLANINRNIILGDMDRYVARLNDGGHLIMSGFYEVDAEMIEQRGVELGLKPYSRKVLNDWCRVEMVKE